MESILHKFIYASVLTFFELLFPSLLPYETFEILFITICIEIYFITDTLKSLKECKYTLPKLVGLFWLIVCCVPADWLRESKYST